MNERRRRQKLEQFRESKCACVLRLRLRPLPRSSYFHIFTLGRTIGSLYLFIAYRGESFLLLCVLICVKPNRLDKKKIIITSSQSHKFLLYIFRETIATVSVSRIYTT